MLHVAHRFSKPRMLQLACPFLGKNSCQGKNEPRKTGRTPSPLNWGLFSEITFRDIVNDRLLAGQGRILFLKYALKYTYLLPNFFFHLHRGPQLCNLLDTFTGISSILPQDVVLGVRTTNDGRPVVGAPFPGGKKKAKQNKTNQTTIKTASKHNSWLLIKFWSPHSWGFCTLSVLTTAIHHIFRAVRASQWLTETEHKAAPQNK